MTTVHNSPPSRAKRHRLPDSRKSVTVRLAIGGVWLGYFTVGLYPNGQPGEIFITQAKAGSTVRGLLDAWATMVSMALQSGVQLRDIVDKFKHWRFEPAGLTTNRDIPMCDSMVDFICKWLELRFLKEEA